jgi:dUTPase
MKILYKNAQGLVAPIKANDTDAGYDVIATSDPLIRGEYTLLPFSSRKVYSRVDYIEYETNLYIAPEKTGYHIEAFPRSSISNRNLILKNCVGTIDNGYRGPCLLRFAYIYQPEDLVILPNTEGGLIYAKIDLDKIYRKGDKVAQFKLRKDLKMEFHGVNDLPPSVRGEGGFGSTGR